MLIRSATQADADPIREVVFGVLAEYGLMAEHQGVDADLDDLEGNYFRRGGVFEVVEMGDEKRRIVGTVGLYPRGDGVCELRKMYLLPELRGQGLGKKLLERMIAQARTRGFRRIELETSSKLVEAIGLYKRYGFLPTQDAHVCLRCDQAWVLEL